MSDIEERIVKSIEKTLAAFGERPSTEFSVVVLENSPEIGADENPVYFKDLDSNNDLELIVKKIVMYVLGKQFVIPESAIKANRIYGYDKKPSGELIEMSYDIDVIVPVEHDVLSWSFDIADGAPVCRIHTELIRGPGNDKDSLWIPAEHCEVEEF